MRSAITLRLGILLTAAAPAICAQVNPSTPAKVKSALADSSKPGQQPVKPAAKPTNPAATKPAAQTPKPVAQQPAAKPAAPAPAKPAPAATGKPAGKPATQAGKPGAKSTAKGAAKAPVKPAAKTAAKARSPRTTAPAESEIKQARRDPFESMIGRQQSKGPSNLPPGKAGLQVSTLRLDGVVKAPNGMIAVVSNPQARTYFLREGDHLYDGTVEKISMDGVSFHEEGKDAFGKPVERQVNKRIYTSSGEQQ